MCTFVLHYHRPVLCRHLCMSRDNLIWMDAWDKHLDMDKSQLSFNTKFFTGCLPTNIDTRGIYMMQWHPVFDGCLRFTKQFDVGNYFLYGMAHHTRLQKPYTVVGFEPGILELWSSFHYPWGGDSLTLRWTFIDGNAASEFITRPTIIHFCLSVCSTCLFVCSTCQFTQSAPHVCLPNCQFVE